MWLIACTSRADHPRPPEVKYLLDERLGTDLEAKAALYRDADPKNDPPIGGGSDNHACTFCHAASAEEK